MKTRVIAVIVAVLFVISVVSVFAVMHSEKPGKKHVMSAHAKMKCDGCGKTISNKSKAIKMMCDGKKYTMCSKECKQKCMKTGKCRMMNSKGMHKGMGMDKGEKMGKGADCADGVCRMPGDVSKKAGVESAVCPVMGEAIPDVSKAYSKETYKGKTYYFCCPQCKPMFDRDPEKYIKK